MPKKTAIAYYRCSTDKQDCSIADQKTAIERWAKQHGYVILKQYIDDGISGSTVAKRPGFLQMVSDVSDGDFEAVLIWDSFRFSRNLIEFLTYKQLFKENGKRVIAITEPLLDEDSDAQLYLDALNGVSGELYLRKLSKDVCRAQIEKSKRGEYFGKSPFGYERKPWNDGFTVIEDNAEWVRFMFQSVRDGKTYHFIAQTLRENEVKTNAGGYFDARAIYRILNNTIYKGYFTINIKGTVIENQKATNIPAIVSEELWDSVHEILTERKARTKKYSKPDFKRKHWLSGHVFCAKCGSPFCYALKPSYPVPRFQCKGYSRGMRCYTSTNIAPIEEMVLEKLEEICGAPLVMYEKKLTLAAPAPTVDFGKEIAKIKAQLTRAKKAYLAEIDTLEEYRENKERLTTQLQDLEAKKEEAEAPAKVDPQKFQAKAMNALEVLRSDCSMEEKMAVADSIIDRVTIDTAAKTIDLYFFA